MHSTLLTRLVRLERRSIGDMSFICPMTMPLEKARSPAPAVQPSAAFISIHACLSPQIFDVYCLQHSLARRKTQFTDLGGNSLPHDTTVQMVRCFERRVACDVAVTHTRFVFGSCVPQANLYDGDIIVSHVPD